MILLKLFFIFFKIGAFTFGGGYAMLAFIQQEVLKYGWMTTDEIIDFVAISESTPGPFAVNASTYVGYKIAGIPGAICATLGVVLPAFVIILIIAKMYEHFKNSKLVKGCMTGLKPAVIGLIGTAVITTAKSAFDIGNDWSFVDIKLVLGIVLFVALLIMLFKKINPIAIILISAVIGIVTNELLLLL